MHCNHRKDKGLLLMVISNATLVNRCATCRITQNLYHLILMGVRAIQHSIINRLREISRLCLLGRVVSDLVHHPFVLPYFVRNDTSVVEHIFIGYMIGDN